LYCALIAGVLAGQHKFARAAVKGADSAAEAAHRIVSACCALSFVALGSGDTPLYTIFSFYSFIHSFIISISFIILFQLSSTTEVRKLRH